jgi:hypothetical protein
MSEEQTTEDLEHMLSMKDVRDILGVSYGVIYGLIQDGKLRCWKVTGEPISKHEVGERTWGLRFRLSDVREYLKNASVT